MNETFKTGNKDSFLFWNEKLFKSNPTYGVLILLSIRERELQYLAEEVVFHLCSAQSKFEQLSYKPHRCFLKGGYSNDILLNTGKLFECPT